MAQGRNVGVVGQSQFMDSPDREPGVSMMDWSTGNGTAKYWINRLVIESVALGDVFVETTITSPRVHAQGYVHGGGGSGPRREPFSCSLVGGPFDFVRSPARTMHPHVGPRHVQMS